MVEREAFAGFDPPATVERFTVIGEHEDFRFRRRHLRLRLGKIARAFNVRVAQPADDGARVGDEGTLPVQTGRYGIRRAVSDHWIGLAELHRL